MLQPLPPNLRVFSHPSSQKQFQDAENQRYIIHYSSISLHPLDLSSPTTLSPIETDSALFSLLSRTILANFEPGSMRTPEEESRGGSARQNSHKGRRSSDGAQSSASVRPIIPDTLPTPSCFRRTIVIARLPRFVPREDRKIHDGWAHLREFSFAEFIGASVINATGKFLFGA